jgi:hypothetical protein
VSCSCDQRGCCKLMIPVSVFEAERAHFLSAFHCRAFLGPNKYPHTRFDTCFILEILPELCAVGPQYCVIPPKSNLVIRHHYYSVLKLFERLESESFKRFEVHIAYCTLGESLRRSLAQVEFHSSIPDLPLSMHQVTEAIISIHPLSFLLPHS